MGVAEMIQLSGKYGFFVTMGNSSDFVIRCWRGGTLAHSNSFVMSRNRL
jgi:hypothetical protein